MASPGTGVGRRRRALSGREFIPEAIDVKATFRTSFDGVSGRTALASEFVAGDTNHSMCQDFGS
jgi:hypothetical protein